MENKILDWGMNDSFILDKMKQKCFKFNGWQYKSRESKERFRVLCLLEDYANAYYDLQKENERLTVELNQNMIERNNYLSRIDKAIEYIMTELITEWDIKNDGYVSGSDLPVDAITPLLNILQGKDKDE